MTNLTVSQAFEMFIDSGSSYWASSTLSYYRKNVAYFIEWLNISYSGFLINDLPDTVFSEYVIFLRSKEKYTGHPLRQFMNVNGCIKSNTVCTYSRAVRSFLNWLYKTNNVSVRFAEDVKFPRPDNDLIVPLLNSEVVSIDAVFNSDIPIDLRNLCIIHLMLDAGLRTCEVISLTPGNVVFPSHALIVNRSKFQKSRPVPMSPRLEALLLDYIKVFHPTGTLFRKSGENKGINSDVIKSLFLRIKKNTGIDRLHPHLLRHTFATSYIMGGGNLESLRLLLGHYDYDVTRSYLHLANQYLIMHTDIYQLDPMFFKKGY